MQDTPCVIFTVSRDIRYGVFNSLISGCFILEFHIQYIFNFKLSRTQSADLFTELDIIFFAVILFFVNIQFVLVQFDEQFRNKTAIILFTSVFLANIGITQQRQVQRSQSLLSIQYCRISHVDIYACQFIVYAVRLFSAVKGNIRQEIAKIGIPRNIIIINVPKQKCRYRVIQ